MAKASCLGGKLPRQRRTKGRAYQKKQQQEAEKAMNPASRGPNTTRKIERWHRTFGNQG